MVISDSTATGRFPPSSEETQSSALPHYVESMFDRLENIQNT